MSLFNTYGEANKRTTKELEVRYTNEPVIQLEKKDFWIFKLTRTAEKSYQYFGMTESAAKDCRDAKVKQYTRRFYAYELDGTAISAIRTTGNTSKVSLNRGAGSNFSVDIEVNETDVIYIQDIRNTNKTIAHLRAIFRDAEYRPYDENFPAVSGVESEETAKSDGGVYIPITGNIPMTLDSSHAKVQYENAQGVWTDAASTTFDTSTSTVKAGSDAANASKVRVAYSNDNWVTTYTTTATAPTTNHAYDALRIGSASVDVIAASVTLDYTASASVTDPAANVTAQYFDPILLAWTDIAAASYTRRTNGSITFAAPSSLVTDCRIKTTDYTSAAATISFDPSDYASDISAAELDLSMIPRLSVTFTSSVPWSSIVTPSKVWLKLGSSVINPTSTSFDGRKFTAVAEGFNLPLDATSVAVCFGKCTNGSVLVEGTARDLEASGTNTVTYVCENIPAGTVCPDSQSTSTSASPELAAGATSYEIDWGDGTTETVAAGSLPTAHTYTDGGDFTVKIKGAIVAMTRNDRLAHQYDRSCVDAIIPYAVSISTGTSVTKCTEGTVLQMFATEEGSAQTIALPAVTSFLDVVIASGGDVYLPSVAAASDIWSAAFSSAAAARIHLPQLTMAQVQAADFWDGAAVMTSFHCSDGIIAKT